MDALSDSISVQDVEELNRQKQQAEMIRQYLQVTSLDTADASPAATTPSLSSFDLNELRTDLKAAEQRVERLREELKAVQKRRDEPSVRRSPPPYVPPAHAELPSYYSSASPLGQEFPSMQFNQRQMVTKPLHHLSPALADASSDHRPWQVFLSMHQHRDQLLHQLDSLKQSLNSLERLVSLEPTRNEVHLANMRLDTMQQKTRQLRALKSNRPARPSPFIECRIRQLEHDLVYMLSEHHKDVQAKLELNEQRSVLLLKIMQVEDELTSVNQQMQQLSTSKNGDVQRLSPSPLSPEMHLPHASRLAHRSNNLAREQRVSFRDRIDSNPLARLNNAYYPHHPHHHHHH